MSTSPPVGASSTRTRWILAPMIAALGCRAAPAPAPPAPKPVPVVTSAPPQPVREARSELQELRRRVQELERQSLDFLRRAHEALDQGEYDQAKSLREESVAKARSAEEARAGEVALVNSAAGRLLKDLEAEELDVREAATRDLIALGAEADLLRELGRGLAGEAASRLDLVVRKLEERFYRRQWASGATASTEYGTPNWAASQATGEPDTMHAGDCSTAWASKAPDADAEWLDLTFDQPVAPRLIRVHETYNPGAITKVEAKDGSGTWRTLWEGAAAACEAPRWFEVSVPIDTWTTKEVRITLDSDAIPGWNEIDAVELVGSEPRKALPK